MTEMSKANREALIRIAKARAKQAASEAESREKALLAEVEDLITAEYEAHDARRHNPGGPRREALAATLGHRRSADHPNDPSNGLAHSATLRDPHAA